MKEKREDMEQKSSKMETNMSVNGVMIKQMEKENSGMLMVISTKDSGKMIRQKGMVCILPVTDQAI